MNLHSLNSMFLRRKTSGNSLQIFIMKKFGLNLNISRIKLIGLKWSFLQRKINGLKLIIFHDEKSVVVFYMF